MGDLPPLSHIRCFATCDGSVSGRAGLEYVKSLLRIAPVHVADARGTGGAPAGPWTSYAQLLGAVPDRSPWVNVVCTDPSAWARTIRVPMPRADGGCDTESAVVELWTSKVPNVLFCGQLPMHGIEKVRTAEKYDAIVCSEESLYDWWLIGHRAGHCNIGRLFHIPVPVRDRDHGTIAEVIAYARRHHAELASGKSGAAP